MPDESTPSISPVNMDRSPLMPAEPPRPQAAGLALFVEALQEAGALADLDDRGIADLVDALGDGVAPEAVRLDLLASYYGDDRVPGGASRDATTRRRDDGCLFVRAGGGTSAGDVVATLGAVLRDRLGGRIDLERLAGDDGPLVLRCGDLISPVEDEPLRSRRDTEEIDLDELGNEVETVAVRSLVRSANGLLRQRGEPRRLVPLRGDGIREVYLAADREQATRLFESRFLEEVTLEDVFDVAGWPR